MNLIVIFMTCTCIVMHSLFFQLPNCNLLPNMLYLYGETPLVNCGPRSIVLHLYYHLLQTLFTFRKYYFTSRQTNISFHTIHLILCFQQTSEIDNLTVSWGKVVWLCYVQVPRCCQRRHRAINCLLVPASNNLQKWFLSPTRGLNFGFILRKNLLLCSSYLPIRVSQQVLWDISMTRTNEDLWGRTTTMQVIVATHHSGQHLWLHNNGRPTRRWVEHAGTTSWLTKFRRNQIFTHHHRCCRASHHVEPCAHHHSQPLVPPLDAQLQKWCPQRRNDAWSPPSSDPRI
jgi:hypothetical protein